jgi:hypothetical protein
MNPDPQARFVAEVCLVLLGLYFLAMLISFAAWRMFG